jgi:hypothetical protein
MKGSKKSATDKPSAASKSGNSGKPASANKAVAAPAVKAENASGSSRRAAPEKAGAKATPPSPNEPTRENVTPVGAETPLSSKPRRDASKGGREPSKNNGKGASVITNIDVGFGNSLFIRGSGAGLSWERGQPLECTSDNEWRWQASTANDPIEFKLLINDDTWSQGDNFTAQPGQRVICHPQF